MFVPKPKIGDAVKFVPLPVGVVEGILPCLATTMTSSQKLTGLVHSK